MTPKLTFAALVLTILASYDLLLWLLTGSETAWTCWRHMGGCAAGWWCVTVGHFGWTLYRWKARRA